MPKEDERTTDAARAARAEAIQAPVKVTFSGHTYEVAYENRNSIEFYEALEDRKSMSVVRAMLGREQWRTFKERHTSSDDAGEFMTEYGKVTGSGNS